MKLTDRDKKKIDSLRKYSAKGMLLSYKSAFLLGGLFSIVFSVIFFFADPESITIITPVNVTQTGFSLSMFVIGCALLLSYHFIKKLTNDIQSYSPKENRGDEWLG